MLIDELSEGTVFQLRLTMKIYEFVFGLKRKKSHGKYLQNSNWADKYEPKRESDMKSKPGQKKPENYVRSKNV